MDIIFFQCQTKEELSSWEKLELGKAAWLTPYLERKSSRSAMIQTLKQENVKQNPDLSVEEASL